MDKTGGIEDSQLDQSSRVQDSFDQNFTKWLQSNQRKDAIPVKTKQSSARNVQLTERDETSGKMVSLEQRRKSNWVSFL